MSEITCKNCGKPIEADPNNSGEWRHERDEDFARCPRYAELAAPEAGNDQEVPLHKYQPCYYPECPLLCHNIVEPGMVCLKAETDPIHAQPEPQSVSAPCPGCGKPIELNPPKTRWLHVNRADYVDCPNGLHPQPVSAEPEKQEKRPEMPSEWMNELACLQNEFEAVKGKTFHSDWGDFLFLKLSKARAENKTLRRIPKGEVWYWQGDSEDFPESLACPVIMAPDVLRSMLSELAGPRESREELADLFSGFLNRIASGRLCYYGSSTGYEPQIGAAEIERYRAALAKEEGK